MSIESNIGRSLSRPHSSQRELFEVSKGELVHDGRFVVTDDLPNYRHELVQLVETSMQEIPGDIVWFTYKDIQRHFGISKATIARRLQEGLVPGVRIVGSQVQADGNVRRFDRTQLRWLLLAVRFGKTLAANTQPTSQANRSS
jgi:hypothetical protein